MVAHKPRNLKVLTSHGTFTVAIKVSAEKIKRRANKVSGLHSVYLTAESAEDHTGIMPGRKFNRRKHRSLIGTKVIATQPPPANVPHLRLTGADEEKDWLYVVETKGGETRGREKQRYVLLRTDAMYKVDVGGNWARGGVQLLDVILEDHTGIVAVDYRLTAANEARMKTKDEAAGEADTEAADEKHERQVSYPLLSLPPFVQPFLSHSQSQPLTSLSSFQYSTALYSTHSAPVEYSPDARDEDQALEQPANVDDQQQQPSLFTPATSSDESQRRAMFFPSLSMPPHSFTWPVFPPFGPGASYPITHAPPPPPPMQSYPSTSSTSLSSSSSFAAPTQRSSTHHTRNWSSGSASSLVSTVPYSPLSYTSSSSSMSYSSSSAASTPTQFYRGGERPSTGSSQWSSRPWSMSDSPVVSSRPSLSLIDTADSQGQRYCDRAVDA